MLAAIFRLARPSHWIKNLFVLLPVPFALAAGARLDLLTLALGLLGFSLVCSGVYGINDVRDAARDAVHPAKRHRPVASGALSRGAALLASGLLVAAGFALLAMTGIGRAVALTALYLAVNLGYSLGARAHPILDVFLLSSGYVIRVLLGCALLDAPPSSWLLLCSSALALTIGFGKRRADILAGMNEEHRPALAGYDRVFLDQAVAICSGMTLLSYALYCHEAAVFLPGREFAGVPFAAFAVFEYLRLAVVRGEGSSPVELAYRSRPLQLCGAGWLLATAWSLGFPLAR